MKKIYSSHEETCVDFVEMDSELDVLGYGISLIMLNVGMYFVAPVMVIHRIKKFLILS